MLTDKGCGSELRVLLVVLSASARNRAAPPVGAKRKKAQLDGRAFCVATDAVILGFRCFWRDLSAPERCDPGDTSPSLTVCTLRIGWQRDRAGRFWPHMTQRCADQYDQEHVDLRLIAGVQRLLGWRPHRGVIWQVPIPASTRVHSSGSRWIEAVLLGGRIQITPRCALIERIGWVQGSFQRDHHALNHRCIRAVNDRLSWRWLFRRRVPARSIVRNEPPRLACGSYREATC